MRSLPFTFCAAVVAGTIALPASVALAESGADAPMDEKRPGTVFVDPSRVSPGEEVELRVDVCGKGKSARGNSEAFASEARFEPAGGKSLVAEARIRSNAAPGAYKIWVTCKDGHGKATGPNGGDGRGAAVADVPRCSPRRPRPMRAPAPRMR